MTDAADRTTAHYAPLFSRFKADLGTGTLGFEVECLAFELAQIPSVPESGLVLDAGCGTGRYSAAWRTLFPSAAVVGVDINEVILRTGQVAPGALTPIRGNLEALPFASGAFDVVMSRGVIHHTPEPERALRELLRVCKPGGLLYFYTYRHGWYDVMLGPLRWIARAMGARACSRVVYAVSRALRFDPRVPTMILDELLVPIRFAFTEDQLREWLRSSGIRIASVRPVVHAQFGNVRVPVDRRTRWLLRVVPKTGLVALAVYREA